MTTASKTAGRSYPAYPFNTSGRYTLAVGNREVQRYTPALTRVPLAVSAWLPACAAPPSTYPPVVPAYRITRSVVVTTASEHQALALPVANLAKNVPSLLQVIPGPVMVAQAEMDQTEAAQRHALDLPVADLV